jgi:hypothetical protein
VAEELLDRIPDTDRLYMLKDGRPVPPVDVDCAHQRLTAQQFALAARTELLNDGTLRITFDSDIALKERIVYAWVLDDTIVRCGKSEGVFYKRFFNGGNVMSGPEKYVTPAIQAYPVSRLPTPPEEAQLWVTLFRRAGGHGLMYAKRAEFVPSRSGKRMVCPEEVVLLRRHHPALNRSDR